MSINDMNTFQTGLYQHYKGALYYVYGTARHTESNEVMVIYASEGSTGDLWVRPLSMFNETINTANGAARRFEFVGEPISIP